MAVFLYNVDRMWLKIQTHVDLHYAARPEYRSELFDKAKETLREKELLNVQMLQST